MTIRVDENARQEIDELAKSGKSRNAAILDAIHDAYRQAMYEEMRRTSERLYNDTEDRAAVQAARDAIGGGDAW